MPASGPADSAAAHHRSRWMREGRECMAASNWAGAIRAYGQGLIEQPLLGMHYAANLERARKKWRQELPSSTSKAQLTLRWWWWPPLS